MVSYQLVIVVSVACLWCVTLSVFDSDHEYLQGCDYIYTEENNLVGPNTCVVTNSEKTGYYSYIYECNSTNDEYFIKKEYHGNNAYKCSSDTLKNSVKYYRSDGYNFNCSSDRQDCSCLWSTAYSCESADFNDTSFIVGTCLPPNATFVSSKKKNNINNTSSFGRLIGSGSSIGSIQVTCTTNNLGKITEIDYQSGDDYCGSGQKAKNTTTKAGCNSQTGHSYMLMTCNMPK